MGPPLRIVNAGGQLDQPAGRAIRCSTGPPFALPCPAITSPHGRPASE